VRLIITKLTLIVITIFCLTSCAHTSLSYKQILPRSSFVKLERDLNIKTCTEDTEDAYCEEQSFSAVASGVVIQNTLKGSYILTAAHVCDDSDIVAQFSSLPNTKFSFKFRAITLDDDRKTIIIVNFNVKHDVCVVWAENMFVKPVVISPSAPEPGDRVLNIAAPLGIFSKNMVPIFEGFYNGDDEHERAVYSLPAFGGSSGSPIVNEKGELIGMVHSTIRYFHNVSLSPNYHAMRGFINTTIDEHMRYRFFRSLWRPFMEL
jgi:S1-C subfamily serine protease